MLMAIVNMGHEQRFIIARYLDGTGLLNYSTQVQGGMNGLPFASDF